MDRDEVEVVKYAKNEKLAKLILWPRLEFFSWYSERAR